MADSFVQQVRMKRLNVFQCVIMHQQEQCRSQNNLNNLSQPKAHSF